MTAPLGASCVENFVLSMKAAIRPLLLAFCLISSASSSTSQVTLSGFLIVCPMYPENSLIMPIIRPFLSASFAVLFYA